MRKSNLASIIAAPFMNAAASQTGEMFEDIHGDFKNRYMDHVCFVEGEGGEENPGGGEENPGGQAGGFEFDYDKFAAAFAKVQGQQTPPKKDESAFDKQKRQSEEQKKQKEAQDRLIADHDFNTNFSSFISDNGGVFGDLTAASIEAQLDGIEGDKLTNAKKALTAKHAFSNESLLDNLQPSDRKFIESIMSKNETVIDGDKAWKALQSALFVESKKERDASIYKANDESEAKRDTPNLVSFLDKLQTKPKAGFQ